MEDEPVTFDCQVSGHPKPTVHWEKVGGRLGLLQSLFEMTANQHFATQHFATQHVLDMFIFRVSLETTMENGFKNQETRHRFRYLNLVL